MPSEAPWYVPDTWMKSGLRKYSTSFCVILPRNYIWEQFHPFSPWGSEKEEINNQAKHIRERLRTSRHQMILFNYIQSNKTTYIWLSWVAHFSSHLMSLKWIWNLHFKSINKITWRCVVGAMCCGWGNKSKMKNLPRKVLPREKWLFSSISLCPEMSLIFFLYQKNSYWFFKPSSIVYFCCELSSVPLKDNLSWWLHISY